MKKMLALLCIAALAMTLGACSTKPATTASGSTSMLETINGQQVDLAKNDVVVALNYQGQYIDQLEPREIDAGWDGGNCTYKVAIFGDVVNVSFSAGEMYSEGTQFGSLARQSNCLITIINAPPAGGEDYVGMHFFDVSGNEYRFSLGGNDEHKGLLIISDSGRHSAGVEPGRILYATYKKEGYKFIVEADETKQVQDQPVNYLYLQYEGGAKTLLAQSVDQGDEYWTDTVRNILNPVLCQINKRVYYETDSYSRTNGAGANNHFTRVIDLNSSEDTLFSNGGIYTLLTEHDAPYGGYLILQGYELHEGGLVPNYFVVKPDGETLCYLGLYVDDSEMVEQINAALSK